MWQYFVYTESDSVGRRVVVANKMNPTDEEVMETLRTGPYGRCVYDCDKVIGIEDSSAGIVSIKFVGFSCVGIFGGNIEQVGIGDMCDYRVDNLMKILDVLG